MCSRFYVLSEFASCEYVIKKSRFIAWGCPVSSRADFHIFLNRAKSEFPDARHHCYAYIIGGANSISDCGSSDAGEPAGTAGKPILNVLEHKDIGNIGIIVSRYFGGIKLGTGGLVRAYSHAAQMLLDIVKTEYYEPQCLVKIGVDFAREHQLRYILNEFAAELMQVDYADEVGFLVSLKSHLLQDLQTRLAAYKLHADVVDRSSTV